MKYLSFLALFLVTVVAYTYGQRCPGSPRKPSCRGPANVGHGGRNCKPRITIMWYYDARAKQCRELRWLGCGGNHNRWCAQALCEQRCRRR